MSLIFDRKVPDGVVAVAMSTLGELAVVPDSRGGRSPLAKAIVSNTPLPVYSLRLNALTQDAGPWDAGLAGAEPESWRVFVMDSHDEPTGVADVAPPAGGAGAARFLSYTQGPQAAFSGQALTDAEGAEPLRSRDSNHASWKSLESTYRRCGSRPSTTRPTPSSRSIRSHASSASVTSTPYASFSTSSGLAPSGASGSTTPREATTPIRRRPRLDANLVLS
jgi:hypothetical protein